MREQQLTRKDFDLSLQISNTLGMMGYYGGSDWGVHGIIYTRDNKSRRQEAIWFNPFEKRIIFVSHHAYLIFAVIDSISHHYYKDLNFFVRQTNADGNHPLLNYFDKAEFVNDYRFDWSKYIRNKKLYEAYQDLRWQQPKIKYGYRDGDGDME